MPQLEEGLGQELAFQKNGAQCFPTFQENIKRFLRYGFAGK
jgi:hypothetical protein